jgi:hypothetical protein
MITDKQIADALGQRLSTMSGCPPIVWENKAADPAVPYLRIENVRVNVLGQTLSEGAEHHRGFLSINVLCEIDKFDTAALAIAQSIKDRFPMGFRATAGDGQVTIMQPPTILQGYKDGELWRTPVRVPYEAV